MMNWKNITVSLVIMIAAGLLSAFITYKATINSALETNKQSIEALTPSLLEAIKKETTAIKNDIKVQVDKIKKSDSININIKQVPDNQIHQIFKEVNCIPNGYTLIKKENLTRKQRKRLNVN